MKIKLKFFLRGLGVGICVATLCIMIVFHAQIDRSYIIKEAKKIGMDFTSQESDQLFDNEQAVTPSAISGDSVNGNSK